MNKHTAWLGERVIYSELSGKEQESFNSARLKALMTNWGYLESFTVNGDKWGPDIIFYRSSDGSVLKVQLKGRPVLDKHYFGKDIYVAFEDKITATWYVYSHDDVLNEVLETGRLIGTESWNVKGGWSWSYIPSWLNAVLDKWIIASEVINESG
jgi:hypothetical protein